MITRCPNIFNIENMRCFYLLMTIAELAMLICFIMSFGAKNKDIRMFCSNIISVYYGAFVGFVLGFFVFRSYIGIAIGMIIFILFFVVINNCIKSNFRLVPEFWFWWQIIYIITMLILRFFDAERFLLDMTGNSEIEYKVFECDGTVGGYEYHIITIIAVLIAFLVSSIISVKNLKSKRTTFIPTYYVVLPLVNILSIIIGEDLLVGLISCPSHLLDAFYPTMGLGYLQLSYYCDYGIFIAGIIIFGLGSCIFTKKK